MDLIIRNARIRKRRELFDIGIERGRVVKIEEHIAEKAEEEIGAGGRSVSPAFVDPHIHLDKVLTAEYIRSNISVTLKEAIEILWEAKRKYIVRDIKKKGIRGNQADSHNPGCGLSNREGE